MLIKKCSKIEDHLLNMYCVGAEASGEVIEIGSEVSNCSVGDRVAVSVQGTGRVSAMSGAYGEQVVVSSKASAYFLCVNAHL